MTFAQPLPGADQTRTTQGLGDAELRADLLMRFRECSHIARPGRLAMLGQSRVRTRPLHRADTALVRRSLVRRPTPDLTLAGVPWC